MTLLTAFTMRCVRVSILSAADSFNTEISLIVFISVLPTRREVIPSPIPAKEVTKVALRLKYQIEIVIPCEMDEWKITKAHSNVITPAVVRTAKSAGGEEHKACVVYCLLVVKKWFKKQAILEMWNAELHNVRAVACEVIAKMV